MTYRAIAQTLGFCAIIFIFAAFMHAVFSFTGPDYSTVERFNMRFEAFLLALFGLILNEIRGVINAIYHKK